MKNHPPSPLALCLLALLVFGAASVAHAGARFEGLVAGKTAADTNWDVPHEKVWSNALFGYVAASAAWGFDYSVNASALLEYRVENGEDADGELIPELRELYGKFRIGSLDLYVGQQITSWATADVLSPLDQLNPLDFHRALDQELPFFRLGTPMIRPVYFLGPVQFEAAYMPLFTSPRYGVVGGDWSLAGYEFPVGKVLDELRQDDDWRRFEAALAHWVPDWQEDVHEMLDDPRYFASRIELPDQDLTAPEGAARVRYSSSAIDVQAAAFYLWDDIPTLHLNPDLRALEKAATQEPGEVNFPELTEDVLDALRDPLRLVHHRTPSAGVGASRSVWDIGLRAEGLYEWDKYTYRRDLATVRRDRAKWTVSADYTFAGDLMVEGVLYQGFLFGREDDFFCNAWTHMVGLVVRRPFFDEKLTFEGLASWDLSTLNGANWKSGDIFAGGWMLHPTATWSITDPLKLTAGVNVFGGDEETLLGYLEGDSRAFASVRYGF